MQCLVIVLGELYSRVQQPSMRYEYVFLRFLKAARDGRHSDSLKLLQVEMRWNSSKMDVLYGFLQKGQLAKLTKAFIDLCE